MRHIMPKFSHVIRFLCRYQPEQFFSILALAIKSKLLFTSDFAHKTFRLHQDSVPHSLVSYIPRILHVVLTT